MDMPKTISEKLDFTVIVYQQFMKQLSLVDSFKGRWETIELRDSKHYMME